MKLSEKQIIFTRNIAKLIQYIESKGYGCTFGDAFRSQEQVNIYVQQGKGVYNSLHCKRLAIDLNLINQDGIYLPDSKDYEQFGLYWETLNAANRSGCFFKNRVDGNHFEMQDED